jgi:hypothetical protein
MVAQPERYRDKEGAIAKKEVSKKEVSHTDLQPISPEVDLAGLATH